MVEAFIAVLLYTACILVGAGLGVISWIEYSKAISFDVNHPAPNGNFSLKFREYGGSIIIDNHGKTYRRYPNRANKRNEPVEYRCKDYDNRPNPLNARCQTRFKLDKNNVVVFHENLMYHNQQ